MKKLAVFIIIFMVPLLIKGADSFSILYHEKFLSNGDTVIVTDKLNNSLLLSLTAIPKAASAVLMARKAEVSKVPGSVNMFSFGYGCWQGNDSECDTFYIINPGYLDAIYTEGKNKGVSEFTYTFFNCDNLNDSLQVWAVFNGWTDVEDNPVESEFIISPNPASDYIEINLDNAILSEAKDLKIYNTMGECVFTLTPALSEGEGVRINISHLPLGLYFINIGDNTYKFVVIR
jgi:hypothetical protein